MKIEVFKDGNVSVVDVADELVEGWIRNEMNGEDFSGEVRVERHVVKRLVLTKRENGIETHSISFPETDELIEVEESVVKGTMHKDTLIALVDPDAYL